MSADFCPACGYRGQPSDLFCRGCGGALTDSARAAEPIAQAESLVTRGLLAEAIATLQRAIGTSDAPDLHVALATLYLRRGGSAEARRELHDALSLDPGSAVAYAYLGGMAMHAGRIEEAHAHLDRARDLAPDDLIVLMKRAEFWLRLGILDQARVELQRGLRDGGGAAHVRAMAETTYAAVEKRSRNSFTRKTVGLPSFEGVARLFSRGSAPAASVTEQEAAPWQ